MQSLNDDMDELFRRAGDEYPLNTSGADWSKVMQRLHQSDDDLPEEKKNKKDYKYLWLLLLLPIGFVCGRYARNDKNTLQKTNKEAAITAAQPGKTKQTTDEQTTGVKDSAGKVSGIKELSNKSVITTKTDNAGGNSSAGNTDKLVSDMKVNDKEINKPSITTSATGASSTKAFISEKNIQNKSDNPHSGNTAAEPLKDVKEDENVYVSKLSPAASNKVVPESQKLPVHTNLAAADTNKKTNISLSPEPAPVSTKSEKIKQETIKPKFYYSIVAAPDISTVKLQKTSNVGYSFGLVLGYKINKKISIEAGALWDRKNYYTDGKYIDTSRLKLPRHLKILTAEGYCNMIEIPVNIKYNIVTKKDHSWFVSAGLSSYLMTKEYYDASYKLYGMTGVRGYGYNNSSKDWFSIMNVSAGYQKTIGKYTNISIAPYLKMPLRGIGIGKLPVTSTGINVSFSRAIR